MFKEAFSPVIKPVIEFPPCKILINALGKTDFIQNLALDFVRLRNSSGLTESEKEKLKKAIKKIKKGERVSFSEFGDIMRRKDTRISGTECLDSLENTAILLLANHPTDGPLGGWSQTLVTSSEIKRKTGKETLWTHGEDKSTFQNVARRKLSENSGSTILVRGGAAYQGAKQMTKLFQQKNIVGIHPEGDGRDKLGRAVSDTGHFMLYAAKKGIPIICSAGFFDLETGNLNISFFMIDPKEILELAKDETKNQEVILHNRQKIADYTMSEIAKRLPFEKRGFYTNFVLPLTSACPTDSLIIE